MYCGIDFGTKRIGLAVGDVETGIASPVATLTVGKTDAERVQSILHALKPYDIHAWVVGLPLHMDGTQSKQSDRTRKFADALGKASDLPVLFFDERMSSLAAEGHLAETGFTHLGKKRRLDGIAAQVILQDFLDSQGRSTGGD